MNDSIMQAAWAGAAGACVFYTIRVRPRGLIWPLITLLTLLVVLDKAVDLQTAVYVLSHDWIRLALASSGLLDARVMVKGTLLALGTLIGLCGLVVAARVIGTAHAGSRLALGAFGLITILVGARMIPGLGWLSGQTVGWIVELVALALIAAGLLSASRHGQ